MTRITTARMIAIALLGGPLSGIVIASDVVGEIDPQVLEAEARRIAVIEGTQDTVLAVFSPRGDNGGSGVVISSDGYALTNFHVVAGTGPAMKCGMADGRLYDAVLVGIDPVGDVALVKLLGRDDFPTAPLGDSDLVRVGDWALAVGNPFMLAADFRPTVTSGIISGVHRYQYPTGTLIEYTDCIQTDASINPGNSGGPLFDVAGRVIGINGRISVSMDKRGRVNVGVGYAISINPIKNFMGHLRGGRIVDHATLGALVTSDSKGRVVVDDILESSDAYRRGLTFDDEIVALAGRRIGTVNALKNVLGTLPSGWRVPLSYVRDGITNDIMVRLAGVHAPAELEEKLSSMTPSPPPAPNPDEDEDEPRSPMPHAPLMKRARQTVPMPDAVRQLYEPRSGYANYYFNRLNVERVAAALAARGNLADRAGAWQLAATIDGGGDVQIVLADDGATAALPGGQVSIVSVDDLSASLVPPGTGGMLPALYLWRKLTYGGPAAFADAYYVGTCPSPDDDGRLVDLLGVIDGGVECHFMIDPDDGRLMGLELFSDESADSCQIELIGDGPRNGGRLPARIVVRHGDQVYAAMSIGRIDFDANAIPAEDGASR